MENKKIVLVTGATGAQGGSVARALLARPRYKVRVLTRDPSSPNAIALANEGAEVMQGDFADKKSLQMAMQDAYAVFGVTDYWEHFEKEYELGKNLIDAVHAAGVKHFIFSSQPDYHHLSNGNFNVPHFDIKSQLKRYAISVGVPVTFIHMSFYYENFLSLFPLQKDENDNFYFSFPQGNTKLAMASVEDLGAVVSTILKHPKEYIGRAVGVVGEDITCAEYAVILTKVLKQPVHYRPVSRDEFASLDIVGAEHWANMFEVQRQYVPDRWMNLIESFGLNPAMKSFAEWGFNKRYWFSAFVTSQLNRAA